MILTARACEITRIFGARSRADVREAHEAAGYRIAGLAPTNAVAQDLKADGFAEAGTVHAALFGIKNGPSPGWGKRTVLVVDEAAMLDSRVTGELLTEAKSTRR